VHDEQDWIFENGRLGGIGNGQEVERETVSGEEMWKKVEKGTENEQEGENGKALNLWSKAKIGVFCPLVLKGGCLGSRPCGRIGIGSSSQPPHSPGSQKRPPPVSDRRPWLLCVCDRERECKREGGGGGEEREGEGGSWDVLGFRCLVPSMSQGGSG
jgi:hypothetical protein